VGAQLTLLDKGLSRDIAVLDGVLEGHDVGGPAAVDLVDQGGNRRRLARPGGAADEDEAGAKLGDLFQGGVEI